jgi:L-alanine-DL-glutamate epimerase-like enolase superfamily enzyme
MTLQYRVIDLLLCHPFTTGRGTASSVRQILITLEWNGAVGFGSAVPSLRMLPEVIEVLDRCRAFLEAVTPFECDSLFAEFATAPSALMAAIDMAVHDLRGKCSQRTVRALIGVPDTKLLSTGLTIGINPRKEFVAQVLRYQAWPILKLKFMSSADLQRVEWVREAYGGRIWIDANGCWSAEEAAHAAEFLHAHGVELLEQPVAPGRTYDLRFVRNRSPIPIVADEDCQGVADVSLLRGCVDAVNIKLSKCGGLTRAIEMIRTAKAAGLKVMLGSKTESVLGVTAIAQLAGLSDYLDLDGHLDIADDPFSGIVIDTGEVTLPATPGLGVSLRDKP